MRHFAALEYDVTWFVYIRSTLHARSIYCALPVERGEKDRGTKGKLEAPLTSTCFLIGGPQIFFVRWCNVYVFYFSVSNRVWLFTFVLWSGGGGYLGKITAGYVSHKRVLKQNLEKSTKI